MGRIKNSDKTFVFSKHICLPPLSFVWLCRILKSIWWHPSLTNSSLISTPCFSESICTVTQPCSDYEYGIQIDMYIQWSLTYPDLTYPEYSFIQTPVWEPINIPKWFTYLEIKLYGQSAWERRCPDKWGSTVYILMEHCNTRQIDKLDENYKLLISEHRSQNWYITPLNSLSSLPFHL